MVTLMVQHRVRDFKAWHRVYKESGPLQKELGVTSESVHQAKDDPNNVLVIHHFATMAAAEAFMSDARLPEAMQRGGVESAPRFEFWETVK